MSGNGPRRLPSPVRPLLSLLGFDSEAERGAFVAELRRKVVPRSLSLATLGGGFRHGHGDGPSGDDTAAPPPPFLPG